MSARTLWSRIEPIHAVTYFSPESGDAAKAAGLKGFWMGYFGFRASPLGPVVAGVVEAAFANFAPTMVRRAIPDAWSLVEPARLTEVRVEAAARALRRLCQDIEPAADDVNAHLAAVISEASALGRPLFAANRDLERFDDPVAQLWQHCTTLREHRGDGHVGALAAAGVDGCEAHLLLAAEQGVDPHVFFESRGWSTHAQAEARNRLAERGLLDGSGLTSAGRLLRGEVEASTDARASEPFGRALGPAQRDRLSDALKVISDAVLRSETIPFPNPMGLPRPEVAPN